MDSGLYDEEVNVAGLLNTLLMRAQQAGDSVLRTALDDASTTERETALASEILTVMRTEGSPYLHGVPISQGLLTRCFALICKRVHTHPTNTHFKDATASYLQISSLHRSDRSILQSYSSAYASYLPHTEGMADAAPFVTVRKDFFRRYPTAEICCDILALSTHYQIMTNEVVEKILERAGSGMAISTQLYGRMLTFCALPSTSHTTLTHLIRTLALQDASHKTSVLLEAGLLDRILNLCVTKAVPETVFAQIMAYYCGAFLDFYVRCFVKNLQQRSVIPKLFEKGVRVGFTPKEVLVYWRKFLRDTQNVALVRDMKRAQPKGRFTTMLATNLPSHETLLTISPYIFDLKERDTMALVSYFFFFPAAMTIAYVSLQLYSLAFLGEGQFFVSYLCKYTGRNPAPLPRRSLPLVNGIDWYARSINHLVERPEDISRTMSYFRTAEYNDAFAENLLYTGLLLRTGQITKAMRFIKEVGLKRAGYMLVMTSLSSVPHERYHEAVVEEMKKEGVPMSAAFYNLCVVLACQGDDVDSALEWVSRMIEALPEKVLSEDAFSHLLHSACSSLDVDLIRAVHEELVKHSIHLPAEVYDACLIVLERADWRGEATQELRTLLESHEAAKQDEASSRFVEEVLTTQRGRNEQRQREMMMRNECEQ